MVEESLILLKPGFVNEERKTKIEKFLKSNNMTIICQKSKKYSKEEAMEHYINKSKTSYYDELTDYLTSDVTYGYVVKGQDAIDKTRDLVKDLRQESKDVMRNVCHGTSKTEVDGLMVDLDSSREIKIFLNERK